jgi:UDP-glucose 4-epimerase
MKKIIVTGGAGYIGSHVVKILSESSNYEIHVIDNFSQSRKNILERNNVLYHETDICEKEKLVEIFKEIVPDVVFHFAALASVPDSVKNPSDYYKNNVVGSLNLLEAMREVNCKKIIFSSSASVYGEPTTESIKEDHPKNPTNPYGQTKLMVEKILMEYHTAYGLSSISFRYFCAAGVEPTLTLGEYHTPETHVIPSLIETVLNQRDQFYIYGDDFATPDGTGVRDYIHVQDLANAHVKAMNKLDKEIICDQFNLGINKGFSVRELINSVEEISGKKLNYEVRDRRPGDPARLIANATKAMESLGWQPEYTEIKVIIETAYNSKNKLV